MSSDYSLSSSRKSTGRNAGEKSYDEEFQKFLEDMTESEVSRKPSALKTPWWMEDADEKDEQLKPDRSKNFLKQSKKATFDPKETKLQASLDNDDDQVPKLSLDNSTLSTNRDVGNKTKQWDIQEDDKENDEYEDDFSEQGSSMQKSNRGVVERPQTDDVFESEEVTEKRQSSPEQATTNLLSKVMFMDSIEGGTSGITGKKQKGIETKKIALEANTQASTTQQQLNDTHATLQKQIQSDMNAYDRLTTQTRNDLEDLALVYQNYAGNDSGVNTLVKATLSSEQPKNLNYYDLVSSKELRTASSKSEVDSSGLNYDSRLGQDVIQAVTDEVENELAAEILKKIESNELFSHGNQKIVPKARQINKSELNNWKANQANKKPQPNQRRRETELELKVKEWPPKKMKKVESTGYGSTWNPPTIKRTSIVDEFKLRRSSSAKSLVTTNSKTNLNQSFDSNRSKNKEISDLKDALINCVDENEKKLRDVRKIHQEQITELRSQISELTFKLKNQSEQLSSPKDFDKPREKNNNDKELEKRLKEQDQLLKAYETENKKLYADLKKAKEVSARELKNLQEEKKQMQVDIIKEKLTVSQEGKNHQSSKETDALREENSLIRKRLEFYEKNQRQIEDDVKEIDSNRQEIKRLKDKIKLLEAGRAAPEHVRELKRTRQQLREMELLVKRLRKSADPNSGANLSLDYYEKRIEVLEAQLKEKVLDLDRHKRMWEEKFKLLKELGEGEDVNEIESRLESIENGLKQKISHLEAANSDLKDAKLKLEVKIAEKEKEVVDLRYEMDNYVKQVMLKEANTRSYRPQEFLEKRGVASFDFDYVKNLIQENERTKIKLVSAENELRLQKREHEIEIERLKTSWQQRQAESNRKHKVEVEKLINILTETKVGETEFMSTFDDLDELGIFDDPIQQHLLKRLSKRTSTNRKINFSEQTEINNRLKSELARLRERCRYLELINASETKLSNSDDAKVRSLVNFYEDQLKSKNMEIDRFRSELDVMLKVLRTFEGN